MLDIDCGDALTDTFVISANQAAGEYTRSYADLAAGTECTVSGSSTGATGDVSVAPGLSVTVAIAPGTTTETVITNTVTQLAGGGTDGGSSDSGWLPMTGAGSTRPLLLAGGGVIGGLVLLLASALIKRRRAGDNPAGL